jgi:sugar O-acyltransferase (sialic acid O-acetyltransferase NeuD family)
MTTTGTGEMILWGATGQAKVLRDCMRHTGIRLVAVVDRDPSTPPPFPDVPFVGGREAFERWLQSRGSAGFGFLVAIGGERGRDRLELQAYLGSLGATPLVAVHATAFVAPDAHIGLGSQILAQAAVCVEAQIGEACIVNTAASVDHECRIGDGVHIMPGAHLAGCVTVERCATIGTGAAVIPRIRVGQGAVVGAGAVVIEDVPDWAVVVGSPARIVGSRKETES